MARICVVKLHSATTFTEAAEEINANQLAGKLIQIERTGENGIFIAVVRFEDFPTYRWYREKFPIFFPEITDKQWVDGI